MQNSYGVIFDTKIENLESSINGLIKDGYKPQGGICVITQNMKDGKYHEKGIPTPVFYQAMLKL